MHRAAQSGLNRRALLRGAAGALAALGPFARIARSADALASTTVAPGVTVIGGAGANVVVLATDAGKVLVDGGSAAASEAVLRSVGQLPGGNVVALFNTHWHADQVGSNEALGSAGATIFAHAKTRQRLSAGYYVPTEDRYEPPLLPAGRPTQTFHASGTTTIGARRIEYGYLLEAHTDGDIYVFFPEVNVVAVGDAVSPVHDPELDWFGGGWLGGRVDALSRLLEIGDANTRFVPSRGPVIGRAQVQAERDMLLELFGRMVEHVRLGETAADMLAAGLLDGLGRTFEDPAKLLYDVHKGFWAHHNALTHDIV
jgi:glyoxylase-like metal-dependent hydrolase (beta-lactamase superfamily II)